MSEVYLSIQRYMENTVDQNETTKQKPIHKQWIVFAKRFYAQNLNNDEKKTLNSIFETMIDFKQIVDLLWLNGFELNL